jgi:fermentation-respiration switch protein FrsA (DUF1100 family)
MRVAYLRSLSVLIASVLLTGCIERLFFYPDAIDYGNPKSLGLDYEDVVFSAPDGSKLHGWFIRSRGPARGSVLHLHGNAANVSNHLPLVAWLPAQGLNVMMFDYRGFGKSRGKPTLDGVVQDARAALDALRARTDIDAKRLVVYGHSLGGASALRLLAQDRSGVRLAIIESAFDRYRGIAREAAGPGLGTVLSPLIAGLPGPADDPLAALARIDVPLVFIHGTDDRVIPMAHGERLFAAAREPKRWIAVPGAAHMEAGQLPQVRAAILEAIATALGQAPE